MKLLRAVPRAADCVNYTAPDPKRHKPLDKENPFRKYKKEWRQIRKQAFEKHGKLCVHCLETGKAVKLAKVIDHVKEWRRPDGSINKKIFLEGETRPLCVQCHNRRSQRQRARLNRR